MGLPNVLGAVLVSAALIAFVSSETKVNPGPGIVKPAAKESTVPDWEPVKGVKSFSVNVNDKIEGANQVRHETWKDGVVEGYYASPVNDGKWLKVHYVADKAGYRVTSSNVVEEAQLTADNAAANNEASVKIGQDTGDISYTVKEDEINKAAVEEPVQE